MRIAVEFWLPKLAFLLLGLTTFLWVGPSQAQTTYWQGQCVSKADSRIHLGVFEAMTEKDVKLKCASSGGALFNPKQVACTIGSSFYGCTGKPSGVAFSPCNSSNVPSDAISSGPMPIAQRSAGRVCVLAPKKTVTMSYCVVYSGPRNTTNTCTYDTKTTGGCPWARSISLTVEEAGNSDLFCWSVYNEADHRRDFTLFVK